MNLIFDLDDTLCRTADYFRQELIDYFVKREDWTNLEVLARHATDSLYKLPEYHRELIEKVIIPAENYLLDVRPTLLFNYFFLIPGNLDSTTKVSLCTMRGIVPNGMAKTQQWLDLYQPVINIRDIHVLNPKETPSKLDYLRNVYGEDFLLIDDNPFYDIETLHEYDPNVLVYEGCVEYEANRHQKKITFENNTFVGGGKVIR